MLKLKKRLSLGMFLGLTVVLSACASQQLILHPITDKDIYFKDNGDICFSEMYFNTILKAKIEK